MPPPGTPIAESLLCERCFIRRGFAGLLWETRKGEEDELGLLDKENTKGSPIRVGADFVNLPLDMTGGIEPSLSDLLHGGHDGRSLVIRQTINENLDRPGTRCCSIISPA